MYVCMYRHVSISQPQYPAVNQCHSVCLRGLTWSRCRHTLILSTSTISPVALKVGIMDGPMHMVISNTYVLTTYRKEVNLRTSAKFVASGVLARYLITSHSVRLGGGGAFECSAPLCLALAAVRDGVACAGEVLLARLANGRRLSNNLDRACLDE
jgi:hypothetical protein